MTALCLATDRIDPDVMQRSLHHRLEKITDPRFLRTMIFTGLVTAALTFAVYVFKLRTTDTDVARTECFYGLSLR